MDINNSTTAWNTIYRAVDIIYGRLPSLIHELFLTLWIIYTSSHATLTRPSSAAPRSKRSESDTEDHESQARENSLIPEGLSPLDAIMFPVMAGVMLTGMYFLIIWLDDPELLNKILKAVFSFASLVTLAMMTEDALYLLHSFIFPTFYTRDQKLWTIKPEKYSYETKTMSAMLVQSSPIPGWVSTPNLSPAFIDFLWRLRSFQSRRLRFRIGTRKLPVAYGDISMPKALSFLLATMVVLGTHLRPGAVDWRVNNVLAHSFMYSYMSFLSPGSFSTGALLLAGLFFYDIYMVFYTPMMITVATTIEIPAKLLTPQPGTERMAMLGLGDVFLPGLMIAWALRFDLYLWYQGPAEKGKKEKSTYMPASGRWGERFWTSTFFSKGSIASNALCPPQIQGTLFSKPYFHAATVGYVLGLILAGMMVQIYDHGQPALLYLVPGVLGAIIVKATIRGELKELWNYQEGEDDEKADTQAKVASQAAREPVHGKLHSSKSKASSTSWKAHLQALWDTSILSHKRMDKVEARLGVTPMAKDSFLEEMDHCIINLPFLQVKLLPQAKKGVDSSTLKDNATDTSEDRLTRQRKENEGLYERELKELKKMN